jgi:hypothetical protein
VWAVARQEDFGAADFVCVPAEEDGGNVYPKSAFYVQAKASGAQIDLDADAVRWVSRHMDRPL